MPSAALRPLQKRSRQRTAERIEPLSFGTRVISARLKISAGCLTVLPVVLLLIFSGTVFPAEQGQYKLVEVKPHVFVWQAEDILEQEGDPNFSRAANAGFVITPGGVVVVNTTNTPFNARGLLYQIRQHTDLPVRYVINTSASPDAMLGNEAFTDFSPTILSTPAAAALMNRYRSELPGRIEDDWRLKITMRGIHPTPPDKTFAHEMTLPLPGTPIKLINLGDNASPGDAVVYLPQAKVLFLGDLFQNQFIPRLDSSNIRAWITTLRRVEAWDAEVFVPGHGQPGGRQQVEQFRQFLEWLLNEVQTRRQHGKSEQQVEEELIPFRPYPWHGEELEPQAVASVYRQLARGDVDNSVPTKKATP